MNPSHPWLRRRAGAWILTGMLLSWNCGCQQWALRPDIAQHLTEEDEDDWAPPVKSHPLVAPNATTEGEKRSSGWWANRTGRSVPRVVLPRDRKQTSSQPPRDPSASLVAFGANDKSAPGNVVPSASLVTPAPNAATPPTAAPSANAVTTVPPTAPTTAPAPPAALKVVDTGVTDVDIEGALQSLPNEYRDVIKKTLTALKEGSPSPAITNTEGQANPATPSVSVRIAESEISRTDSETKLENTSSNDALPEVKPAVATSPLPSATLAANTANADVVTASATEAVKPTNSKVTAKLNESLSVSTVPNSWHQTTSQAIESLEHQLESSPPTDESMRISLEITLRMLYVAQRRLDDALRPVERLSDHEQEYVQHQMQALYEASNPDANPARSRHWSLVMNSQREATSHLAAVSNLEVRSVAFCTQVDGYGVFQRFAKNHFTPDQDVLLYCEIDNVAAEKVKLGYETQLQGSYEIRDSQGRRVAEQLLPMEPELCQNHRRDYFIVYRIYMPQQIAPGDYQLRLTIEDMKGRKFGQSNADFTIRK